MFIFELQAYNVHLIRFGCISAIREIQMLEDAISTNISICQLHNGELIILMIKAAHFSRIP